MKINKKTEKKIKLLDKKETFFLIKAHLIILAHAQVQVIKRGQENRITNKWSCLKSNDDVARPF